MDAFFKTFEVLKITRDNLEFVKRNPQTLGNQKTIWANEILRALNVEVESKGQVCLDRPLLLLGNHIGYLDIPLLMAKTPEISFLAKSSLKYWPIFGKCMAMIDVIFVNRNNKDSRLGARHQISRALVHDQKRIVIFPSGTTTLNEEKPWRNGGFELAQQTGASVQFFRISYSPLRKVAYIEKDFFPKHLLALAKESQIQATIEFSEPVQIKDLAQQRDLGYKWVQEIHSKN